jgi:hypothetical protein
MRVEEATALVNKGATLGSLDRNEEEIDPTFGRRRRRAGDADPHALATEHYRQSNLRRSAVVRGGSALETLGNRYRLIQDDFVEVQKHLEAFEEIANSLRELRARGVAGPMPTSPLRISSFSGAPSPIVYCCHKPGCIQSTEITRGIASSVRVTETRREVWIHGGCFLPKRSLCICRSNRDRYSGIRTINGYL